MKVLIYGLQKEYFHKINIYGLHEKKSEINKQDVEFNIKLLDITFEQFDSIIRSDNDIIYSDEKNKQQIRVFNDDGGFR